jgi:predicted flap endonuclease-1-like 5' DNA nuclease
LICSQLETDLAQRSIDLQAQLKIQAETLTQQSHQQVSNQRRQREALESKLADNDQSLRRVSAERDALAAQLSELTSQLDQVASTVAEREKAIDQLELEVEEAGTLQVRIRELEALLERRESEMQELNVTSGEAQLLREQFSSLQDQYAIARRRQVELEANLERRQNERQHDQATEDNYRAELEQYQTKLAASADTIRTLRRERAAVLARLANYRTIVEPDRAVISFTQAMELQKKQSESYDEEYGGHTTIHAKRGLIYVSEPETRDDLKRISGIAEVLEARLNDYGIYTFKQIMEWSEESIDEFSNLLTFRDRIQRDDWQHQARYFYDQKHANQEKFAA